MIERPTEIVPTGRSTRRIARSQKAERAVNPGESRLDPACEISGFKGSDELEQLAEVASHFGL